MHFLPMWIHAGNNTSMRAILGPGKAEGELVNSEGGCRSQPLQMQCAQRALLAERSCAFAVALQT